MLTPLSSLDWDLAKAGHLLNRAGFGGAPSEIAALHQLGVAGAVESLLHAPDDSNAFPKPAWAVPHPPIDMRGTMESLSPEERQKKIQEVQKTRRDENLDLSRGWLDRMRRSPNPLREKMTLFWHGHFATSVLKVQDAFLMWQQNDMLRSHALGNFGVLTKAVSRDPAMMFYLDTQQNRKSHPNENFARELMELFTLGIGHYSEEDIQQAARAFTNYKLDLGSMSFRDVDYERDEGEKKFFGRTGRFTGDDIIDMILDHPACAQFMARKLWRFFVYDEPSPALIDELASTLRENEYELQPLMAEIFRSAEFYSAAAIRSQIKSPIQWLVQTAKVLEIDLPPGQGAINVLRGLGQMPFVPPNVKGWDGGKAWINTSTLLMRYNLAGAVTGGGEMGGEGMRMMMRQEGAEATPRDRDRSLAIDLAKIAPPELRAKPKALVEQLGFRLYQTKLTPKESEVFLKFLEDQHGPPSDQSLRGLLNLMMSTPEFQLT